ncbi:tRNA lysidine(34) synthetase TilS [Hoylesella timonensis]|uniref:tRNA lysidine(34) synthetase TilS n=1 Tax=Hoylesella timonensis TaxID=386414 RepID=UPI001E50CFCA|nr:tRNA lysidine(34) synthetase TilS [Hoylesella timonensis]
MTQPSVVNDFERHIEQYISSLSLLNKEELYLVALSGGADSVCLLRCLQALGYRLEAVHCHFHLRAEEADRDLSFCQDLCAKLQIPFHSTHFDTKTYAQSHGVSIEMAARDLRYSYFRKMVEVRHAAAVCVGHHSEDSVETILLNLVRSTGIHGLTGISPKKGIIVRPLLCVNRLKIIDYLQFIQQNYVTDSTNFVADVQRNQMRLQVIPQLEKINPAAQVNILKAAQRLSDIADIFDKYLSQQVRWQPSEGYRWFPVAELTHEYILWYLLKDFHFTSVQVEQIWQNLHGESGKQWQSSTHALLLDRKRLLIAARSAFPSTVLSIPRIGNYRYDDKWQLAISQEQPNLSAADLKNPHCAFVDSRHVVFPLCLRPVRSADRFQPFGMKGSQLLSDYMTNRKMSVFDKRMQLVLTDAHDHIVWVVNQRTANWCRVTDETTVVLKIVCTAAPCHSSSF